jgi:hypothetical protein
MGCVSVVTAGETQEWEKSGAGKEFDKACKAGSGVKNSGRVEGSTWKAQGRQRKGSRTACFPGPDPQSRTPQPADRAASQPRPTSRHHLARPRPNPQTKNYPNS